MWTKKLYSPPQHPPEKWTHMSQSCLNFTTKSRGRINPKRHWGPPRSRVRKALRGPGWYPKTQEAPKLCLAGHSFHQLTVRAQVKVRAITDSSGWANILFLIPIPPTSAAYLLLFNAHQSKEAGAMQNQTCSWKASAINVCDRRAFGRIPADVCQMRSRKKGVRERSRGLFAPDKGAGREKWET